MVEIVTGARLLRVLIDMETRLAKIEGVEFDYNSPGSFMGMAASERMFALLQRVAVLEGSPAPEIPDSWVQGRTSLKRLKELSARIDALADEETTPPEEIVYPLTIFEQELEASPDTPNNWTCRNILQITGGAGPLGQVRVTFEASATADFRINNASIGISVMNDAEDTPDNGATRDIPVPLFPPASVYVPAGGSLVSEWASLSGFTETDLLVVVIDHNTDTGNPRAAVLLPAFPELDGTRQGYQTSTTSYHKSTGLSGGVDGRIYAVSKIEVQ